MDILTFFGLARDALSKFRAASYLFGVIAVVAVIGLAKATTYPWQVFAFGALGVFVCAGMLAIAGAAHEQRNRKHQPAGPTTAFIWLCLLIFAAWSLLFTSCVFFSIPKSADELFGIERPRKVSELQTNARAQLQGLLKHQFFTNRNFEASVGGAQNEIRRICRAMVDEAKAWHTGGTAIDETREKIARHKSVLAQYRDRLPEIRLLVDMLSTEIAMLKEIGRHPQLGDTDRQCVKPYIGQMEAFRRLLELIANWIEQPRDVTCETTPQQIDELTRQSRPKGGESRFVDLPSEVDTCLSQVE